MEELDQVRTLISEEISKKGFDLYSFKYLAKKKTLEIIVDRLEPINLDDITEVSNLISDLLDKHDFTDDAYVLDVSSLGIEKPIALEKLDLYVGQYVNLHLINPYKGLNTIEGNLDLVDENNVSISYKDKTRLVKCEILRKDIDKARLAIKF